MPVPNQCETITPMDLSTPLRPHALVVSTGRCGSTALSNALRAHEDVLSLSEFFSALAPFRFEPDDLLSKDQVVDVLTRPNVLASLLWRHHAEPSESLYPVDGAGRYDRSGVPAIAVTALPHLTSDVDELLDWLISNLDDDEVPPSVAFTRLFDALATRFGRSSWVERSGSSLLYLRTLLDMFPRARVVHLHRDGASVAASMATHATARLFYYQQIAASRDAEHTFGAIDHDVDDLESAIRSLIGEEVTPELLLHRKVPVEWFGLFWSWMTRRGVKELAKLPADRVLHVAYEDLVDDPVCWLERIIDMVGVEARPDWIEAQAAAFTTRPRRQLDLTSDERDRLERACASGRRALASIR